MNPDLSLQSTEKIGQGGDSQPRKNVSFPGHITVCFASSDASGTQTTVQIPRRFTSWTTIRSLFKCASYLDIYLVCTPGTHVADMLAHSFRS